MGKGCKTVLRTPSNLTQTNTRKNSYTCGTKKCMGSFKKSFTEEMEKTLVKHILELESQLFGVTCLDLRILAFKPAVR